METKLGDEISELISRVTEGEETILTLASEIENGQTEKVIRLERRKIQPEPSIEPQKKRSPARDHVFHSVIALEKYLKQHGRETSVLLADAENRVMTAVLDETVPDGLEMVHYRAEFHPRLKPWLAILDKATPVHLFAQHLLQHRRDLKGQDAKQMALVFSQIRMSKKVSIQSGVGANAINGVMVETSIQGAVKSEFVELPEMVAISVPIFVDSTGPTLIEIDLLIQDAGDSAVVFATAPDLKVAIIEEFDECVSGISENLEFVCGLGRVGHKQWPTVG